MCGIAGCVVSTPTSWISGVAEGMRDSIKHRGPDDHGVLLWDGRGPVRTGRTLPAEGAATVFLAHRRLSIIDLSETGWQPMSSDDGRYHIIYNGEIYNYIELREQLARTGYRFRGTSDTEVLLAACTQWGSGALPRLVGMFAFALLDVVERRLLLARDFLGIKPLYYSTWADGMAFASEIKALLKLPTVSTRGNPDSLFDYLRHGLTDHRPETLFADARQFPAAHFAWIDLDRPDRSWQQQSYWEPVGAGGVSRYRSIDGAAEELRNIFLDNVRLHLRSDVPIGSALSGGIDSSSIVAGVRAIGGAPVDLRTVSFIADEPRVNEESWIDLSARQADAQVHKVTIASDDLLRDLEHLIRTQDEPFGGTSIYAQYRVFRMAAEQRLKVMLDGQGADEVFAGYMSYLPHRWAGQIRAGAWWDALRSMRMVMRMMAPSSGMSMSALMQRGLGSMVPARLRPSLRRLAGRPEAPSWIDDAWFGQRGVELQPNPVRFGIGRDLRSALRVTLLQSSLPALLRYEDRNSMAHSVESRVPFLTPRLVEFTQRLPEGFLIGDDGLTKNVFRRAMRGIVPDAILDRRDKIGFEPPQRKWLTELDPWVRETLSTESACRLPCLRSAQMLHHWENVGARRDRFDWTVWRWLNAIAWANLYDVEFD